MARHTNKNKKNKPKNHKTSKSTKYWGVVDFEVGWSKPQTSKNGNWQSSSLAATKAPVPSTKAAATSNPERGSKLRVVPENLEGVSHSEAALQISRNIRDTFAAHRGTIDVTSSMSIEENMATDGNTGKSSQGPTTVSGTASTSTSGVVPKPGNDKLTENGADSRFSHSEAALQIAKNIRDTFAAHGGTIDVISSMSIEENDGKDGKTEKPPQESATLSGTSPFMALPKSGNDILTENEESSEVEDSTFVLPESPENLTPPSSNHTTRTELLKHIRFTLQSTSNIQMAPGSLEGVPASEVPMKIAQDVSKNIRDTFAEHRGFIDASSSIPIQDLNTSDDNTPLNQSLSVKCEPMDTSESPKSADNSIETENSSKNSKRAKKRKSDAVRGAAQGPKRKSRRLRGQEEEEEEESEGPESIAGEIPSQDLGVITPLGPFRTPFRFPDFLFDEPNDRLMKQLEVTMNDTVKKTRASITDPLRKSDKKDEEEYETISVAIGKEYQAELPVLMEKRRTNEGEDEDRDESFWKFPDQKELEEALGRYRPPTLQAMENYFETRIQKDYWPAIWRQFKGHIPLETALQHLMKNNYSVLNALESIDKCLEVLPQRFKDVCMEQAKRFIGFQKEQLRLARREKRLPENGVSHAYEATNRREIQKRVLRNYHIGEIEHFLHHFHRFYLYSEEIDGEIGCNCDDVITAEKEFVPRFACKNCTKHIRDTSKYPENNLCYICQKFKELAGIDRPVRDLVLDDDELRKIDFWNQFEKKLGEKINREDFEHLEKVEKLTRLQAYQLTEEEIDILTIIKNGRLIAPITKSQFDTLDDQKKQEKINEICAKLEPLVLPQFISCNCKKSGGITRYSNNFGRTMFNLVEEQKFAQAIAETKTRVDGSADLKRAGKKLNVEPEFVEVFLREYGKDDPIWNNWPNNHFHDFQPRNILPNQNMPSTIFG